MYNPNPPIPARITSVRDRDQTSKNGGSSSEKKDKEKSKGIFSIGKKGSCETTIDNGSMYYYYYSSS
jgi:hypothetical protein